MVGVFQLITLAVTSKRGSAVVVYHESAVILKYGERSRVSGCPGAPLYSSSPRCNEISIWLHDHLCYGSTRSLRNRGFSPRLYPTANEIAIGL